MLIQVDYVGLSTGLLGFLALHQVLRVIQEIQSNKQSESNPRPFNTMDSIPNRTDLLRLG